MPDFPSTPLYQRLRVQLVASPRVWLVTGAAGFIGSHLVQALLELGQRVVGLDDFSTGHQSNLDEALSARPDARPNFRLLRGDIRDAAICRQACEGVDYVLHQAALASVPRSIADPVRTHGVNVDGFLNVLVAARDARVRRLVYASSSSVYGDATVIPQVEDHTGRVLSPQAASKAANELFAGAFERTYGLESVGLRYFNVFGPRQDPNGAYAAVIPRWISRMLDGTPCTVYGDGETSRDFCFVANAVQANLLAATTSGADVTGQAFNVACGQPTSLNELFRMTRLGLTGYHPSVAAAVPHHEPERQGDMRHSRADIGKARRRLGYEPEYRVSTGLGETIEWYAARAGAMVTDDAEAVGAR